MSWTIWIILAYGAFQVLTWALQNVAKNKEQQRARQNAQLQQRAEAAQAGQQPDLMRRSSSQPTQVADPRSRREQLAARRREQLDQLRRQREGRAGVQVQTQPSRATAPVRTQQLPSPPPRANVPDLPPGFRQWQQQQQERAKHDPAERVAAMRRIDAAEGRQIAVDAAATARRRAVSASRDAAHTAEVAKAGIRRQRVQADRLRMLLNNKQSLADFFILKEILDPPISMQVPGTSRGLG